MRKIIAKPQTNPYPPTPEQKRKSRIFGRIVLVFIAIYLIVFFTKIYSLEIDLSKNIPFGIEPAAFSAFDDLSSNPTRSKSALIYFLYGYFLSLPFLIINYVINRKVKALQDMTIKTAFKVIGGSIFLILCSELCYFFSRSTVVGVEDILYSGIFSYLNMIMCIILIPVVSTTALLTVFDRLFIFPFKK